VVPATEWVNTGSARVVGAMSKGAS
jgi:hypothetical protein